MVAIRWIGAGLLFCIALLVLNTCANRSRQLDVVAIRPEIFKPPGLAAKLADGLRIQTVSSRDPDALNVEPFEAFRHLLAAQFPLMHNTLQLELVGQSLLFLWNGAERAAAPVLLMAHLDVVPVQKETEHRWTKPPFSGEVSGGYVWGRGALDNKGALYMICAAVERLVQQGYQPARDIWISFGHDEEVGGKHGNAAMAKRFADANLRFEAVIDEGGSMVREMMPGVSAPVAVIGIAEKGYLTVRLTVEGQGGHSSTPPRETTVSILSRAVTSLQDHPFSTALNEPVGHMLDFVGPEMPFSRRVVMANRWLFSSMLEGIFAEQDKTRAMLHTTIAPTMLNAGIQENVLAKRAEAIINFRIVPGDTRESVLAHVSRTISDKRVRIEPLIGFSANPSPVSSPDSAVFQSLQQTIHEIYPDVVVAPFLMMAATDSRHYIPVADHVYRFMPYQLDAQELTGIHGINERISVDSLARGAAFYHQLIRNLDRN